MTQQGMTAQLKVGQRLERGEFELLGFKGGLLEELLGLLLLLQTIQTVAEDQCGFNALLPSAKMLAGLPIGAGILRQGRQHLVSQIAS